MVYPKTVVALQWGIYNSDSFHYTKCSSNGSECIYRCHKFQNFLGEAPPPPNEKRAPPLLLSPLTLAPSAIVKHASPMSKSFRRHCIAMQVWWISIHWFIQEISHFLGKSYQFVSWLLTLIMGSRSPKDIQLQRLSKRYICASLERIKPMAQEIYHFKWKSPCDLENEVMVTKI